MRGIKFKENNCPGTLITFCGLDGSGKTTLIKKLNSYLISKKTPVVLTKQPTDDIRQSKIFRTYMDEPDHTGYDYRALSLSAAGDRIQHTEKFIYPKLMEGNTVLSDRYFYSCLANLRARGYANDEWIYEVATHILKPDISFFMDISVEEAVRRVRTRISEKDKYIDMELQYRLREQYLSIAENCGGIVIETSQPPEKCWEQVCEAVENRMMSYV